MARIIYGVSGEGSGHSSRAREMLTHLEAQGHKVKVLSYENGLRNLSPDFDVEPVFGLTIASPDNKVSVSATLRENLRGFGKLRQSWRAVKSLAAEFAPDCVITDFEPLSAYLAWRKKLPLISIDNQHRIRYMKYPRPKGFIRESLMTRVVIKAMVPRPWVSLITTFYFGQLHNQHSYLFPPILRSAVLERSASDGSHVLVYTTKGFDSLLTLLPQFADTEFRIYGYDRDERVNNLHYRPFSADGFLDDLASCKAVISTAGFTLLTEALHFGKPQLVLPMRGQFEQALNGLLLNKLEYGRAVWLPTRDDVGEFLARLDEYRERLSDYPRTGNTAITERLDSLLANGQAELLRFRR